MALNTIDSKPPFVLAIGSYAVHGVASLKTFIKILGSSILPVPSLVLSGLTNIQGIKKFELPFADILANTLEIAASRNQQLIFYTGYLGSAEQAEVVTSMIKKYRSIIKTVITDPVCGDNGKAYVSTEVIGHWAEIIRLSDMVTPNITELKLITGYAANADETPHVYIDAFKMLYPNTQLLLSSYAPNNKETGVQLHNGSSLFNYTLPLLPQSFGGSGDLLLALFIRDRFFNSLSIENAITSATDLTHRIIKFSIANGSNDLLLNDDLLSN